MALLLSLISTTMLFTEEVPGRLSKDSFFCLLIIRDAAPTGILRSLECLGRCAHFLNSGFLNFLMLDSKMLGLKELNKTKKYSRVSLKNKKNKILATA